MSYDHTIGLLVSVALLAYLVVRVKAEFAVGRADCVRSAGKECRT